MGLSRQGNMDHSECQMEKDLLVKFPFTVAWVPWGSSSHVTLKLPTKFIAGSSFIQQIQSTYFSAECWGWSKDFKAVKLEHSCVCVVCGAPFLADRPISPNSINSKETQRKWDSGSLYDLAKNVLIWFLRSFLVYLFSFCFVSFCLNILKNLSVVAPSYNPNSRSLKL